jgi:outer membrane receptor protein involved in Fe transport
MLTMAGFLRKMIRWMYRRIDARLLLVPAIAAAVTVLSAGMTAGAAAKPAGSAEEYSQYLDTLSLEELMQVTIVSVSGASRYEQKASEAPAQVSVIDAETIRRFGYRTLADALQGETGINITNDRNYQYLGYRGLSLPGDYNTRVLIMIDGIRLNDEVYHQAPIGRDFPLDMDLVERVEIIRGPSNALYGNNAFFLTINVITVSAQANRVSAAASIDTRALATGRLTGEAVSQDADRRVLVSGTLFNGPGSKLYFNPYNDPANNFGITSNCDYERGGSFFLKAEKGGLTLLGGYSERQKGIPTGAFDTLFNVPGTQTWDDRSFADLSYLIGDTSADSIKVRGYYNGYYYKGRYIYDPADQTLNDNSRSAVLGGEFVFTKKLPFENHMVGGVDYRYTLFSDQWAGTLSGAPTLDVRSSQHSVGVFLQNEWSPVSNLRLVLGARYDHMSPSLNIFSPKAAVIYKIRDNLIAKYLFGKSFRSPNAFEKDYFDPVTNTVANPHLGQESMLSNELLLEYFHGPGQRLSMSVFNYQISDLITQTINPAGQISFQNHEDITVTGFELEGDWRWEDWSGRAGYSYQQAENQHSGRRLTNSPDSLLKARISREFMNRRLVLSTEAQYVSSLDTLTVVKGGDYFLLNLILYARDLFVKDLDGSISVKNLFNRHYGQPGDASNIETSHPVSLIPQDGRTATFKLEYRY